MKIDLLNYSSCNTTIVETIDKPLPTPQITLQRKLSQINQKNEAIAKETQHNDLRVSMQSETK